MDIEKVLSSYEEYFFKRIKKDSKFKNAVLELKGKKIACSCKKKTTKHPTYGINDKPCHGDTIANYLNSKE